MRLKNKLLSVSPAFVRHAFIDAHIASRRRRLKNAIPVDPEFLARNQVSSQTEYWSSPDISNAPQTYAHSSIRWDVDWLIARLIELVPTGSVVDFGCNAGRVLHHMVDAGFKCTGVELNPKAVEVGLKAFPNLSRATFHTGPDALKAVTQADAIYSCAVLRHIPPPVFAQVVQEFGRISPKYILTLEDEGGCDVLNFPHDYPQAFGSIGYQLTRSDYAIDLHPDIDIGGIGTMFRVFKRSQKG
jgi:SAM-dependent methyltransferase